MDREKRRDVIAGVSALVCAALALVILMVWMRWDGSDEPIAPSVAVAAPPVAQQPHSPAAATRPSGQAPAIDPFAGLSPLRLTPSNEPPLLEHLRAREEREKMAAPLDSIEITVEHSQPYEIKRLSNTRFVFEQKKPVWFLLKVTGAKDKTLRLDFPELSKRAWKGLNPVYSYCPNLEDPAFFKSDPVDNPRPPVESHNGPLLPDTSGQQWHYIPNVWTDEIDETYSMVHTFDADLVWVAMRAPYLPDLDQRYAEQLDRNPLAEVIEVGQTREKRALRVIKIGGGSEEADRARPCILIHAREQASNHDSSFVAHGAVEFLLSDSPEVKNIREKYTFLIIPLLDPDGAAAGLHMNITNAFHPALRAGPEPIAYAGFFREWIKAGKRLDVVLNLYNVGAGPHPHLSCPLMESEPERRKISEDLHKVIMQHCIEQGFDVSENPWNYGTMQSRMGGYLARFYGPIHMPYEINSQDLNRHLTLAELRQLGQQLVRASSHFLTTPQAEPLLAKIQETRQRHRQRMEKYEQDFPGNSSHNALQMEWESSRSEHGAGTRPAVSTTRPVTRPAARPVPLER